MTAPATGHLHEAITYGPKTWAIVGTYVLYSDAERIRDIVKERQPQLGDLQIGALDVGPQAMPEPLRMTKVVTALAPIAFAAVCGAAGAFAATGWRPSRLLLGVAVAIVVGVILARRYRDDRTASAVPAVAAGTWVVLRTEQQASPGGNRTFPAEPTENLPRLQTPLISSIDLYPASPFAADRPTSEPTR
jgi:hypothetical protein